MNCSIIGIGLAAVGVGMVTVSGANPFAQSRVFESREIDRVEDVLTNRTDIEFTDMSFTEVIKAFDAMTDRSIYVHWTDLAQYGFDRGDDIPVVSIDVRGISLGKAMEFALDQVSDGELAWRVSDDLIELGVAEMFDRRDRTLVSYDIGPTVEFLWGMYDVNDPAEHISNLLLEMVEPPPSLRFPAQIPSSWL